MVLLTMTKAIVEGLGELESLKEATQAKRDLPTFKNAAIGNPISHAQIVDIWKSLQATRNQLFRLEDLLRGSHVYISPLPPKPEPSDEYKALMARLRREEEARAYERMVNPPRTFETVKDRFHTSATSFAEVNRPSKTTDIGADDAATIADVQRQVMLIINFLVSIAGVAATLWFAARWWSIPTRLFLTLGGSIVVAIAEVTVYSGYMWRMEQGRSKDKNAKEERKILQTWVVKQPENSSEDDTILVRRKDDTEGKLRKRTKASASLQ